MKQSKPKISGKDMEMTGSDDFLSSDSNVPIREKVDLYKPINTSTLSPLRSKPSVYDQILHCEKMLAANEITRSARHYEFREESTANARQILGMDDIIQFPYLGKDFDKLEKIYHEQMKRDENQNGKLSIPPSAHLSSVVGHYVGAQVMYGGDDKFWEHADHAGSRALTDGGQDIIGCSIDFKTTVLPKPHMDEGYSLMDYVLAVPDYMVTKRSKTVYVMVFVLWLETDGNAIVYIAGRANKEMLPGVGVQYPKGSSHAYSSQHCLFVHQLKSVDPIQHDENIKYLAGESDDINDFKKLKYRPWVDFVPQSRTEDSPSFLED